MIFHHHKKHMSTPCHVVQTKLMMTTHLLPSYTQRSLHNTRLFIKIHRVHASMPSYLKSFYFDFDISAVLFIFIFKKYLLLLFWCEISKYWKKIHIFIANSMIFWIFIANIWIRNSQKSKNSPDFNTWFK
jgi:hypothetical protein